METNDAGGTAHEETRAIQRVAVYAFWLNIGLFVMKGTLAFFSGSLAITAGAIDSATDGVASSVLYAGVKLSSRKTPSFPLGLYKIENVISVVVAFFIFFAGYEIARGVLSPPAHEPTISIPMVLLLALGVIANYLFGKYAMMVGRRTESPTLMAEGKHRQVDVLSSLAVLASAAIAYSRWDFQVVGISVDRIGAGVVLIFIAHAGWELLSDGMRVLLDASMDFETLAEVRKIIEEDPMVVAVDSVIGRSAGRFRFLQAQVSLRTEDFQKAHQVSEKLETNIRKRIPHVERVLIHYEPQRRTHTLIAVPLADPEGTISDHFGDASYFAFIRFHLQDGKVEEQEMRANPYKGVETAKGIRVAEWLVEQKVDHVLMKEDLSRKGPGYVLAGGAVKVSLVSAKRLDEAIETIFTQGQ